MLNCFGLTAFDISKSSFDSTRSYIFVIFSTEVQFQVKIDKFYNFFVLIYVDLMKIYESITLYFLEIINNTSVWPF